MDEKDRGDLGRYLTELRDKSGLSLRQVEKASGGVASNVYLSQLEHGKRLEPHPAILVALAKVYGIPWRVLFEKAGYLETVPPSAIDVAFEQVRADTEFQFGTRFTGELDEAGKRVIIAMYEKATKKKLLPDDEA